MTTKTIVRWRHIASPVGDLLVATDDNGLRAIEFPRNRHPMKRDDGWIEGAHPLIDEAQRQLDDYFAGKRTIFDVPLAPRGTPFQLAVWQALREIPFGDTWTYGDLARHINQPSAVRAVGAANGRNPIPVIVPCHRVIGSDGSLTGFGGGLPTKEFLLRLEGALPASLL
ncbi:MAG: methylated-DNA--[protein]-cysteine S-methyltransferase [Proteobacteria bacterium]|nr:methylated-DNA--[protein]-cysteine S-methyltransferase [Pseudomonadota bacterium]